MKSSKKIASIFLVLLLGLTQAQSILATDISPITRTSVKETFADSLAESLQKESNGGYTVEAIDLKDVPEGVPVIFVESEAEMEKVAREMAKNNLEKDTATKVSSSSLENSMLANSISNSKIVDYYDSSYGDVWLIVDYTILGNSITYIHEYTEFLGPGVWTMSYTDSYSTNKDIVAWGVGIINYYIISGSTGLHFSEDVSLRGVIPVF